MSPRQPSRRGRLPPPPPLDGRLREGASADCRWPLSRQGRRPWHAGSSQRQGPPHTTTKKSVKPVRAWGHLSVSFNPPPPRPPAHPSQSNGPRNTKKKHMHSWHKGRSSGSPSLKKKRTGDSCATNWRMSILTASVRITGDREEKRRGGLSRTNQGVSGAASTSYPPHGLPPPL